MRKDMYLSVLLLSVYKLILISSNRVCDFSEYDARLLELWILILIDGSKNKRWSSGDV